MSNANTPAIAPASSAATSLTYPVAKPPVKRPRSLLRQTLTDTFKRPGARFGACWLIVLILLGVFAPLIASSHPILMKEKGVCTSPMWRNLTAIDVGLLGAFFFGVIWLIVRKASIGEAVAVMVLGFAVIFPLSTLTKTVVKQNYYAIYREQQAAGQISNVVRTIIPFSPSDRMRDKPTDRLNPPNGTHWLGTNGNSEDLLSGMIHACRIALSVGLISTSISLLIGIVVGGTMGYYVGKIDLFGMRLIEIFEAIPTLLLLITVMAAYGRNLYLMMAVIGLLSWTGTARFVRAEFLRLRNQDFVQAAVATGVSQIAIIFKHILPNGLTPVLVTATFGVASAILTEATLSYLGLGLVDEPSWGRMLNDVRSGGQGFVWWMATFPGAAIFLTVYAYALVGDSMRDALDPKLKKRD